MKSNLLNFEGLYGEHSTNIDQDFIHYEKLESRSSRHNWEIKPHFHRQLYQIFVIDSGKGKLLIENRQTSFDQHCIICIPENCQHGFSFQADSKGSVFSFSSSILDKLFIYSPNISFEFNEVKIIPIFKNNEQPLFINAIIDQLQIEIFVQKVERNLVVNSLLTLLFVELFRILKNNNTESFFHKNKSLHIFNQFQKSIIKARDPQRNLKNFAEDQKISAIHLNRVCKEISSFTASQIVNQYFITEAKIYLSNTDYSVSEIAYQLNFNDAAYFSRLFKKEIGSSPKEFRKKIDPKL